MSRRAAAAARGAPGPFLAGASLLAFHALAAALVLRGLPPGQVVLPAPVPLVCALLAAVVLSAVTLAGRPATERLLGAAAALAVHGALLTLGAVVHWAGTATPFGLAWSRVVWESPLLLAIQIVEVQVAAHVLCRRPGPRARALADRRRTRDTVRAGGRPVVPRSRPGSGTAARTAPSPPARIERPPPRPEPSPGPAREADRLAAPERAADREPAPAPALEPVPPALEPPRPVLEADLPALLPASPAPGDPAPARDVGREPAPAPARGPVPPALEPPRPVLEADLPALLPASPAPGDPAPARDVGREPAPAPALGPLSPALELPRPVPELRLAGLEPHLPPLELHPAARELARPAPEALPPPPEPTLLAPALTSPAPGDLAPVRGPVPPALEPPRPAPEPALPALEAHGPAPEALPPPPEPTLLAPALSSPPPARPAGPGAAPGDALGPGLAVPEPAAPPPEPARVREPAARTEERRPDGDQPARGDARVWERALSGWPAEWGCVDGPAAAVGAGDALPAPARADGTAGEPSGPERGREAAAARRLAAMLAPWAPFLSPRGPLTTALHRLGDGWLRAVLPPELAPEAWLRRAAAILAALPAGSGAEQVTLSGARGVLVATRLRDCAWLVTGSARPGARALLELLSRRAAAGGAEGPAAEPAATVEAPAPGAAAVDAIAPEPWPDPPLPAGLYLSVAPGSSPSGVAPLARALLDAAAGADGDEPPGAPRSAAVRVGGRLLVVRWPTTAAPPLAVESPLTPRPGRTLLAIERAAHRLGEAHRRTA